MKTGKIILNTSNEAAKFITNIEGWVDRHGRFFGKEKKVAEEMARWSGCTHIVCPDCGKACQKSYIRCSDCREKKAIERYKALECKEWDGKTPLYSGRDDEYFFNEQELTDYIEDSFDVESDIASLRLVVCEPTYLRQVDTDYFCDELADDGELPEDVINALDDLNAVIKNEAPVSWSPGKYAADLT